MPQKRLAVIGGYGMGYELVACLRKRGFG